MTAAPDPVPKTHAAPSRRANGRFGALDRIVERLGGRQANVAAAAGRHQTTISKWRRRGVPLSAAPALVRGAARLGYALTLDELVGWIEEENGAARA